MIDDLLYPSEPNEVDGLRIRHRCPHTLWLSLVTIGRATLMEIITGFALAKLEARLRPIQSIPPNSAYRGDGNAHPTNIRINPFSEVLRVDS